MSGGFVKKTIDLEALQRQAELAALEEEAKKNDPKKKSKEKKVKEKKVKEKKVKEKKVEKEKKGKEKEEKRSKTKSSTDKRTKSSKPTKKNSKVKLGPRLFGLPLTGNEDGEPPEFFTDIITYLEGHATEMEGLFRKTASTAAVEELVQRYEAGEDVDWSTVNDYHLIGGVLMAFLLRLPEPLITFAVYEKLMTTATIEDKQERLAKVKEFVKTLPALNFEMLEILLDFLDTMTRDAEDNLMHAENLAICFGPALLRRQEDNLAQLMRESPIVTAVITCLIEYFGFFFRDEEIGADKKSTVKVEQGGGSNLKDFVFLSIKNLETSLDFIYPMVLKLDYTKMWNEETLSYLSLAESLSRSIFREEINEFNAATIVAKQEESSATIASKIKRQGIDNFCASLKDSYLAFITETRDLCNSLKSQDSFIAADSAKFIRKTKFIKLIEEYLSLNVNFVSGTEDDFSTVKKLVPLIKNQLNLIKQDLASCTVYSDAVIISRAVRAAQKVLKEKNKAPMDEALSKPPGGPTAGTQKQIESLQDALEFSFPASEKILNELVKSSSPDVVRDADILTALHSYLDSYFTLKNAPEITNKPNPVAPHPSQAVKAKSPTPVAPHPSANNNNNNNKPPPIAVHPSEVNKPNPVAPHPSQAVKAKSPTPVAPHPSANNKPPPIAAHPSEVNKPPPIAAHPSEVNKPPPIAAHPSEVNKPPPLAPHPSEVNKPSPVAPHPSQVKGNNPPPLAPHPSEVNKPLNPIPLPEFKPIPAFPGFGSSPGFPSMAPTTNAYTPVPLFSHKSSVPFPPMFDDDE